MTVNVRRTWQTILSVAVLMFIIGMAIDTTDISRYASRMEKLMSEGDYEQALEVGKRSDKTDARLLQLRIEALGHEGLLGDRLFAYPVKGRSTDFKKHGLDMVKCGADHELCAYLIDKQLDKFAEALPRYYKVDDTLPRYYREALVQYNHLRSNPRVIYHDSVLDTDYDDLQQLERRHATRSARQVAVFRQYEGTYWYYYEYLNKLQ